MRQTRQLCPRDVGQLRQAVEAAGLGFDPVEEVPRLPTLRVVRPGIDVLGMFRR